MSDARPETGSADGLVLCEFIARAADAIRVRVAQTSTADDAWMLQVAAWLDTGANPYSCASRKPMVAVAAAYLGEPEPEWSW